MNIQNLLTKIQLRTTEVSLVVKLCLAWIISRFIKSNDVWLISERGFEAKDNAYFFYNYIKNNHPEINVKYVISRKSRDLVKFSDHYDDVVDYNSLSHFCYIWVASHLISTHVMGYTPKPAFFSKIDKRYHLFNGKKKIFLQHGIIYNDLSRLYSDKIDLDLFCCGAKPEYDYIKSKFGYSSSVLKYTGLCRYDNLNEFETKRQILVMPTWRMYLNKDNLTETIYFKYWRSFLQNEKLQHILEESGYTLVFYPHFEIQSRINDFVNLNLDKHIIIASIDYYDVQTLLKESDLLITDYSSVFFDMMYMRKPIIFYQFDKFEFEHYHYQKGYIDASQIGQVVIDSNSLCEALDNVLRVDCVLDKKYSTYFDCFFEKHDSQNCERVYNSILNLG